MSNHKPTCFNYADFERMQELYEEKAEECRELHEMLDIVKKQHSEIVEQNQKDIEYNAKIAKEKQKENEKLRAELRNCRDELCLRCGSYKDAHHGACAGCRYRSEGEWQI